MRRIPTRSIGIGDRRRMERQIEAWFPYERKELPPEVEAGHYFVTDPAAVRLVEEHLIPAMPAALFFTGTYRTPPRGRDALETVLADFKAVLAEIGHDGRFFAVAHQNHTWDPDRNPPAHVHAIVDYHPTLPKLRYAWDKAHGMTKAGLADPGARYYVAGHALRGDSLVFDHTSAASVGEVA